MWPWGQRGTPEQGGLHLLEGLAGLRSLLKLQRLQALVDESREKEWWSHTEGIPFGAAGTRRVLPGCPHQHLGVTLL